MSRVAYELNTRPRAIRDREPRRYARRTDDRCRLIKASVATGIGGVGAVVTMCVMPVWRPGLIWQAVMWAFIAVCAGGMGRIAYLVVGEE